MKWLKLYAITPESWNGNRNDIVLAIKGGASCIQYRKKEDISREELLKNALTLKDISTSYNIPLIINDDIDLALEVKADAIHIGQDDEDLISVRKKVGEDMIIGMSCSNIDEALKAEKEGANYLGVGAVFFTSTKKNTNITSIEKLKEIVKNVNIPVVAIGGINMNNIKSLKDTDIKGVAIISAIFGEKNIKEATSKIRKEVDKYL